MKIYYKFYDTIQSVMKEYNLKHFAHIGDAVWEVFIRKIVIDTVNVQKAMHEMTIRYVNAEFQAFIIEKITPNLKENELALVKRGLNLSLTAQKKNKQNIHRHANAFEVLIGYLYLNDRKRLDEIFEIIREKEL
ncbi:MAG: Mini-ribonuclease 3 [Candidatus Gastranaerophilales bacterium]|nr:Mini-ribonuclease 3 [Candidatus Gastranaerophilales bacterium]